MMNGWYVRNFIPDMLSWKFLPYGRNFCHFASPFFNLAGCGFIWEICWIWKRCGMKFWKFWSRNFWHMAEIYAIFSEILWFDPFRTSEGKMVNMKEMRNEILDILILEISGIRQKFLAFSPKFFILTLSVPQRENWWIRKRCGISFYTFWSRNFLAIFRNFSRRNF